MRRCLCELKFKKFFLIVICIRVNNVLSFLFYFNKRIMKFLFFSLLIAVVYSQGAIDQDVLGSIFDKPLTSAPPSTGSWETADSNNIGFIFETPGPPAPTSGIPQNILNAVFNKPISGPMTPVTKKPATNTVLVHREDLKTCRGNCTPFYLCPDYEINNANSDDIITTGYGQLDIRLGEDDERVCYSSVDVCCSVPVDPVKPTTQLIPKKTQKCGYRNPKGIGATFTYADTQFGEFPWVIAVLDEQWFYLGVGVLISPQVVMTAAHIAANYTSGNRILRVRAGEWDTQTVNEIFPFQERIVKEVFIHKDYNKIDRRSNNIALLRFEQPLELSEYVHTICMPEQDEDFDSYQSCIANGWGKDIFGQEGRFAVILKKVELNIVPYSRCSILLRNTKLGSRFKLHQSFLCAGGKEGEDTCEGDGGAPLACPIGDNRYKLTGLVAWGVGCGQKDVPGVYTNVPKFREWVDKKMADWGLATDSYNI